MQWTERLRTRPNLFGGGTRTSPFARVRGVRVYRSQMMLSIKTAPKAQPASRSSKSRAGARASAIRRNAGACCGCSLQDVVLERLFSALCAARFRQAIGLARNGAFHNYRYAPARADSAALQ